MALGLLEGSMAAMPTVPVLLLELMSLKFIPCVVGRSGLWEDPAVGEQKVGEAAAGDGERVGEEDGQVSRTDEDMHEGDVAKERDESVGEMEAEESREHHVCAVF